MPYLPISCKICLNLLEKSAKKPVGFLLSNFGTPSAALALPSANFCVPHCCQIKLVFNLTVNLFNKNYYCVLLSFRYHW